MNRADKPDFQQPAYKDEWLTPPEIIKALGPFDLDPCAPVVRPWDTAAKHFTIEDSGLMQPWDGRVWLNPPYGEEMWDWLNKMAAHCNGIALIFARTETQGFHRFVWRAASAVFFPKGRIRFHYVDGTQAGSAGAPSVLVAYGLDNAEVLQNCKLDGQFIPLRTNLWQGQVG